MSKIAHLVHEYKPLKVFISKCLAHSGIRGNEEANRLANEARRDEQMQQDTNALNRRAAHQSIPEWIHRANRN